MGNLMSSPKPHRTVFKVSPCRCNPGTQTFNSSPIPLVVPGYISHEDWSKKLAEADSLLQRYQKNTAWAIFFMLLVVGIVQVIFHTHERQPIYGVGFLALPLMLVAHLKARCSIIKEFSSIFSKWEPLGITVTFYPGSKHEPCSLTVDYAELVKRNPHVFNNPKNMEEGEGGESASATPLLTPFTATTTQVETTVQNETAVPQVAVQVPSYGGGGPSMVEYNGTYISVDVPKDATPGETIMVDVPSHYLGGGY